MKIKEILAAGVIGISVLTNGCWDSSHNLPIEITVSPSIENEVKDSDHPIFKLINNDRSAAREKYLNIRVVVTGSVSDVPYWRNEVWLHVDGKRVIVDLEGIYTQDEIKDLKHKTKTFEGRIWDIDENGFFINDVNELK